MAKDIRVVTSTAQMDDSEEVIIFNSTSALTYTLTPAHGNGREFMLKNVSTGVVTVTPHSGDTLDGESTITLGKGGAVTITDYYDGIWTLSGFEGEGATTEVLVGGGANLRPVWTTSTGSGAPVRATSPTLTSPTLTTPTLTTPTATTLTVNTDIDINCPLDVGDTEDGGSANGSIIKKTLQAGEAYTTTTAGLMVKCYDADDTVTVPSGEFCGLYVNLKGLHTDPGNNTSLISAHVHSSNTTTVHAGLWLYGDMTNGVKASGSTLTNMIDISQATAVTNLISLPAAGTDPIIANALVPATAPDASTMGADACIRVLVNDVAYYIPLYDTLHA